MILDKIGGECELCDGVCCENVEEMEREILAMEGEIEELQKMIRKLRSQRDELFKENMSLKSAMLKRGSK